MKAILFVLVFFFIYPIFPNSWPVPLDRVMQVIGFLVFCFDAITKRKWINQLLSNKSFLRFYGITLILLAFCFFALMQASAVFDLYVIKYFFDTFCYFFSAYLVYVVARKAYGDVNIGIVLQYITIVTVVQSLICILFFINRSLLDSYLSILKPEVNEGFFGNLNLMYKRFVGFGSAFFTGGLKFGFGFFAVIFLPYFSNCRIVRSKFLYFLSVFLIIIGGVFTARTFLVAVLLGVLILIRLRSKNIFEFIKTNVKIVLLGTIAVFLLITVVNFALPEDQGAKILGFAFEMFQNDGSSGEVLGTSSTDRLYEMYEVIPHTLKTWLIGDGRINDPSGHGYYMHTDIGYFRLIFYFGLPATLFFVFVLYTYFRILSKFAYDNKALRQLFLVFVLFNLAANFKGLAFESSYLVLFLIVVILSKRVIKHKNI